MKKIILIAAILVGSLTKGQAQVINKNYTKRIGQAVKEGYQTIWRAYKLGHLCCPKSWIKFIKCAWS